MKFSISNCLRAAGLSACCLLLALGSAARAADPADSVEPIVEPIGPEPILKLGPDLSGSLSDLSFEPTAGGTKIKISGLVTLKNSGVEAAKAVAATVYLSSTSTLESTAQPLAKLELSTYRDGNGKVKPGAKVSIPLKYKFPTLLAAGLSGQYIIIVLSAQDYSKTAIVYGPLPKVP